VHGVGERDRARAIVGNHSVQLIVSGEYPICFNLAHICWSEQPWHNGRYSDAHYGSARLTRAAAISVVATCRRNFVSTDFQAWIPICL